MSTLKTTNLQHPSASTPNITLASSGAVALNGAVTGGGMDLVNTTTFSAVSSVSLNNVFTSTYQNYLINLVVSSSGPNNIRYRWRASGTDESSANYIDAGLYVNTGSSIGGYGSGTDSFFYIADNGQPMSAALTITAPNLAQQSHVFGVSKESGTFLVGSRFQATNVFDGFTIYTSSSTMTGTVRVYGYKN
jgi:hypothetical protein